MVQLKDVNLDVYTGFQRFQFLMVQLKVPCRAISACFLLVSIPNGSIKSASGVKVENKGKRVSIPNGSIKS